MSHNQVIIAIPIYRFPLSSEEKISLQHVQYFLGRHNLTLVAPQDLEITDPDLRSLPVIRFGNEYFSGISGYNRLMLSREFYRRFKRYEYILICQLDCLVFSDDLLSWCAKGWDYVGAPWFKGFKDDTTLGLWATGNGGLSLRRVGKFLEVLNSWKLWRAPVQRSEMSRLFPNSPRLRRVFCCLKALPHACGYKNTVRHFTRTYLLHEDLFWAFDARQFVSNFNIPSPREALAFAFEFAPRFCYQANGGRLPFGCHAWYKIDPEFWRPFLLQPKRSMLNGVNPRAI